MQEDALQGRTAGSDWTEDEESPSGRHLQIDSMAQIKLSNENPIVATVYNGILKGKEHKLLHNPTVAVGQGQDQE